MFNLHFLGFFSAATTAAVVGVVDVFRVRVCAKAHTDAHTSRKIDTRSDTHSLAQ